MERRQFLVTLVAGGLTLVAANKATAQQTAQQAEELDTFFPDRVRARDIEVTIERNHGHSLPLMDSDLRDYRSHHYDIRGRASHPHYLYLNRNHFMRLNRGRAIRVISSYDYGHRHIVVLRMRRFPMMEEAVAT